MPVKITNILRDGIDRTLARNGLILVGVLFVLSASNGLVGAGTARWVNESDVTASVSLSSDPGPLVAVSSVLAGFLSLAIPGIFRIATLLNTQELK